MSLSTIKNCDNFFIRLYDVFNHFKVHPFPHSVDWFWSLHILSNSDECLSRQTISAATAGAAALTGSVTDEQLLERTAETGSASHFCRWSCLSGTAAQIGTL
jgi:predicted acetyltransferase